MSEYKLHKETHNQTIKKFISRELGIKWGDITTMATAERMKCKYNFLEIVVPPWDVDRVRKLVCREGKKWWGADWHECYELTDIIPNEETIAELTRQADEGEEQVRHELQTCP